MIRPFVGNYPITRSFGVYDAAYSNYPGSRHSGTDYGLPANTPLYACESGRITAVYDRDASLKVGRGKEIRLIAGNREYRYCHLNRIDVSVGDVVEHQPVGLSGYTGYVMDSAGRIGTPGGAHLHFELLIDGNYSDYEKFELTEGEDMVNTEDEAAEIIRAIFKREPTQSEIRDIIGRPWKERIVYLRTLPLGREMEFKVNDYDRLAAEKSTPKLTKSSVVGYIQEHLT